VEQLRHKAKNMKEWNESYYFNFYDPDKDIGGFTRIGFKPNIKEGVGYLFLFYKKEILAFNKKIEVSEVPEKIKTGPLEFFPGWKIVFSGKMTDGKIRDIDLNLTYSEINREFSYIECVDREKFEMAKVVCEDHYEQIGFMKGEIRIDSEKYNISGFSERDHSWGERDWNAPKLWIYVTAHFDKDLGINFAKMRIKEREIDVGFVMKKGKNIPVKRVSADTVSEGNTQKSFEYKVYDIKGDCYTLRGKVLKRVQIPYRREDRVSILNENLSVFECKNKRGFGIAEYLVRIR